MATSPPGHCGQHVARPVVLDNGNARGNVVQHALRSSLWCASNRNAKVKDSVYLNISRACRYSSGAPFLNVWTFQSLGVCLSMYVCVRACVCVCVYLFDVLNVSAVSVVLVFSFLPFPKTILLKLMRGRGALAELLSLLAGHCYS